MHLRILALVSFLLAATGSFAQSPAKFAIAGSSVTASADDGNVPANTVDGSLSTRWSAQGDGQWIRYDLGSVNTVSYVKIAWYQGDTRTSTFDVQLSGDGSSWNTAFSGTSNGTSTALQTYDFTDASARYVRIVGHGNSSGNGWNSISETEVWGISSGGGGPGGGTVPFTVEAESVSFDGAYWSNVADASASAGHGLKELVNSTSSAPAAGGLLYPFTLNTAGTVYLQIKAKAANTSSDSCWVRLDSGSWAQFTFDSTGSFTWRNKQYTSVSAGSHTFELRCREANAVLDLVAVTLDTNTPPPPGGGGGTVAAPSFSPAAGTYSSAQAVTITSATSGASIRYTTDGSTPSSTVGTVYSTAVNIGATSTLKAIAYKSGMTDSTVTSGAYTITLPVAAAPSFSPVAGTYTSAQSVTITTTTSGASIRYTTDGSTPSATVGTVYSTAVSISATTTLKAIAYKSGMADSSVTSGTYTINLPQVAAPSFSPPAGTYSTAQSVTITTATSGASIRYTTDGSTPSATVGTVYASPVNISVSSMLKAIAYKFGMTDSAVTSGAYTISDVLDPNLPPGSNFDLSHWKITLPTNSAEERSPAELTAGFEDSHFHTDPVTGGMVFNCPDNGETTGGSTYPRTELREMLAPTGSASAANNNWVTSTSSSADKAAAGGVDGTLNAILTVDHVSTTGDTAKVGRVVIGQIHAPDTEVIRLYYRKLPGQSKGTIYFGHDSLSDNTTYYAVIGNDTGTPPADGSGVPLGELFSYQIKLTGHVLSVTISRDAYAPVTVNLTIESGYDNLDLYFKAGVYNQNNTGDAGEYAQATFYDLTHTHP